MHTHLSIAILFFNIYYSLFMLLQLPLQLFPKTIETKILINLYFFFLEVKDFTNVECSRSMIHRQVQGFRSNKIEQSTKYKSKPKTK